MNPFKKLWNWLFNRDKWTGAMISSTDLDELAKLEFEPKPEHIRKGIVSASAVQDVREQLDNYKEQQIRNQFLSPPKTKRRQLSHHNRIPAIQHSDAIAKYMVGKGKGQHKWYRRSVKAHVSPEEN